MTIYPIYIYNYHSSDKYKILVTLDWMCIFFCMLLNLLTLRYPNILEQNHTQLRENEIRIEIKKSF